ncbi:hypothetical protein D4A39_08270 [Alcanivorax profundi]|uniref:Uncharacterized protein n=1 Tax=Alcanivorax profundi TaxID=2338368 RepID=A0A418XZL5_9GAMM|nr:hypothetical protein [Alcanivorax profundi]RJG18453.1 hypothetical protein D4A39_08270 [Alcanivorax profundi]
MSSSEPNDLDATAVLSKGWEIVQELAKSNGESAWNIRAWGISVWCALLAYGYTSVKKEILVVAVVLLVVVFLIEIGIRQVQYKFIERSLEIEHCLNQMLAGSGFILPESGVSTNISTPSFADMLAMLSIRRWLIWFPYLLLLIFTLGAIKNF